MDPAKKFNTGLYCFMVEGLRKWGKKSACERQGPSASPQDDRGVMSLRLRFGMTDKKRC